MADGACEHTGQSCGHVDEAFASWREKEKVCSCDVVSYFWNKQRDGGLVRWDEPREKESGLSNGFAEPLGCFFRSF